MGVKSDKDRDLFYWLALSMAPEVGDVRFNLLLDHFDSPENVFKAKPGELAKIPALPKKAREGILNFDWAKKAEDEILKTREMGVQLLTSRDAQYPVLLKAIRTPPPILWVKGEIKPQDQAAVAIVGSRGATEYGRRMSARLAGELASAGLCVVSGLALGIDSSAHEGALAGGGRTLAVLGCGIDVPYPRPNRDLAVRIPGQGALISEFKLGTTPEAGNFPRRNRIISGLSLGVVVVEAGGKSGSLITARLALDQNREVFAVPGQASSLKTQGTHMLLKQGAKLVENAQDILDEIAPQMGAKVFKPVPFVPEFNIPGPKGQIFKAVCDEPLHIDRLGRLVELSPALLAPLLLEMELDGLIRQLPGMRYTRA